MNIDRVRSALECLTYTKLKHLYCEHIDANVGKITAKQMRRELVEVVAVQELYGGSEV